MKGRLRLPAANPGRWRDNRDLIVSVRPLRDEWSRQAPMRGAVNGHWPS
jgi:hypothetical protein